ncbi:MAG: hypothetical protein GY853_09610, partial [PVC group bacterium]|nr:hypothetical protein [PVC group bacterium]
MKRLILLSFLICGIIKAQITEIASLIPRDYNNVPVTVMLIYDEATKTFTPLASAAGDSLITEIDGIIPRDYNNVPASVMVTYNAATKEFRAWSGSGGGAGGSDTARYIVDESGNIVAQGISGVVGVTKLFTPFYQIDTNIRVTDDSWIGLGSGDGQIVFDNQATDEVNILNAFVGIGTSTPYSLLHVYDDNSQTGINVGALIEQDGTGDAKLQFNLFGAQRYSFGIDNSDGDKLKLSSGAVLGLTNIFAIDPATGFFGYGTQNPASPFHIYENTGSTGSNTGLTVEQDGVGDAKINLFLTSSQRCNLGLDNTDN